MTPPPNAPEVTDRAPVPMKHPGIIRPVARSPPSSVPAAAEAPPRTPGSTAKGKYAAVPFFVNYYFEPDDPGPEVHLRPRQGEHLPHPPAGEVRYVTTGRSGAGQRPETARQSGFLEEPLPDVALPRGRLNGGTAVTFHRRGETEPTPQAQRAPG